MDNNQDSNRGRGDGRNSSRGQGRDGRFGGNRGGSDSNRGSYRGKASRGPRRDSNDRKPYDRDNSERRPYSRDNSDRKPYERDNRDRKPYSRDNAERKPFDRDNRDRKPYNRDNGERRAFRRDDSERRPYDRDNRDRKPYDRDNGERRAFRRDDSERRPYDRDNRDRKPYDRDNRDRKPYDRENKDRFKAREIASDEYKASERLDDDGYRAGVSAVGMFVKPKYNKKFAANQGKLTDPEEMSDAGKAEVEEGLREDRLEGRNPIKEALAAGRTIDKLWVLKPKDGRRDKAVSEIISEVKERGGIIMEVDRPALDRLSITNAHQGMIAQTAVHDYVEVADILAAARVKGEDPLVILLDEIKDSYNLGSVFRIADAAGAHGIIIPRRRSVGLDALVAKASAGAIEHVPCARVTNLVNTMEELKKEGLWIAGTAMEGSSELSKTDLSGPMAIVIGSEGEGMRDLVRQNCDLLVSIPMKGKVNSLNAAVAAGIVIFEAVRQRDIKSAGKAAAVSEITDNGN